MFVEGKTGQTLNYCNLHFLLDFSLTPCKYCYSNAQKSSSQSARPDERMLEGWRPQWIIGLQRLCQSCKSASAISREVYLYI